MPTLRGRSEAWGHKWRPGAHSTLGYPRPGLGARQRRCHRGLQVALTELSEGPVGSPLQGDTEVISCGRHEPSRQARVRGVSRDVHVDVIASMSKLTVQASTVGGSPRVAKAVQHVPEQGRKAGTVQPIAMEPTVGSNGDVGVVIHPSVKKKDKWINISSIE
jgi:hypothetical protein